VQSRPPLKPAAMIPSWISSAKDLVTSQRATRDGFLEQALAKAGKATPFVGDARRLQSLLDEARSLSDLAASGDSWLEDALLSAAGFSDKAKTQLSDKELRSALREALKAIIQEAPDSWREEVVSRFLLTKGDSLGGTMRNVTGALGASRFAAAIVENLTERGLGAKETRSTSNSEKITSISWKDRRLEFDRRPHFCTNNVDAVLYDTRAKSAVKGPGSQVHPRCLACGELKGGIDPAGADEHWKTGATALQRVRDACSTRNLPQPATFFIGAAIEPAMAEEIFAQLKDGSLDCAANLTVPEQLSGLVLWLVGL